MHTITSVETNIKWNRASNVYFPQHGIWKGDKISPYIFVLCMEKLSHLILEAVNDIRWKALRMGKGGP